MKQSYLEIWKGVLEGAAWRNWCESYDLHYLQDFSSTPQEYVAARSKAWEDLVEQGVQMTDFSEVKTPQVAQKKALELAKELLDMIRQSRDRTSS
jgi:hypothetical protein